MPLFDVKVTATVINYELEADTLQEAINIIMSDLSTRFAAYTVILPEETIIVDVTVY